MKKIEFCYPHQAWLSTHPGRPSEIPPIGKLHRGFRPWFENVLDAMEKEGLPVHDSRDVETFLGMRITKVDGRMCLSMKEEDAVLFHIKWGPP